MTPIQSERSAGGVLFKTSQSEKYVCLIKVLTRGGNPSWRLPKGAIEEGETPEQAAVRETQEETGCTGEILSKLTPIDYWYTNRDDATGARVRIQKHVQFYLLKFIEGDTDDHDHEVEEAQWFPFSEAIQLISYDTESRVLQEANHAWDAYLYRRGEL